MTALVRHSGEMPRFSRAPSLQLCPSPGPPVVQADGGHLNPVIKGAGTQVLFGTLRSILHLLKALNLSLFRGHAWPPPPRTLHSGA